jgi:hypothetical protein
MDMYRQAYSSLGYRNPYREASIGVLEEICRSKVCALQEEELRQVKRVMRIEPFRAVVEIHSWLAWPS